MHIAREIGGKKRKKRDIALRTSPRSRPRVSLEGDALRVTNQKRGERRYLAFGDAQCSHWQVVNGLFNSWEDFVRNYGKEKSQNVTSLTKPVDGLSATCKKENSEFLEKAYRCQILHKYKNILISKIHLLLSGMVIVKPEEGGNRNGNWDSGKDSVLDSAFIGKRVGAEI